MGNHHEPFAALGPVDWADVAKDDFKPYLDSIFTEAQTVVESIPSPASNAQPQQKHEGGRARAKTDSAVLPPNSAAERRRQSASAIAHAQQLWSEWKEIKVNPRENPLGVKVYKLGSKDGRGAWFARRSVHEGLSFDQWKAGLDHEFIESMKVQGAPGSGSIRGIGADKRVENHDVPDAGHIQVFQLSAQFPGPTSPRDFITLLLTSDFSHHPTQDQGRPLRQYMIVSKPCTHPECPPRQGIIRGQYESVELIREIPIANLASKRSHSSADLISDKTAAVAQGSASDDNGEQSGSPTAIEWLMVTRSDPGGSVPRFMIEKGTPPGIVNDAGKFLTWVTNKASQGSQPAELETPTQEKGIEPVVVNGDGNKTSSVVVKPAPTTTQNAEVISQEADEGAWSSNGLYGMLTGAFGAASSVVSGGLRRQFTAPPAINETASDSESSTPPVEEEAHAETSPSETSSIRSFASALERSLTHDKESESLHGSQSEDKSQEQQPQLKELRRLQERRRKLDEKAAKMAERMQNKKHGDKEKDAAALAKIREKHEKEIAKQEAKYRRELRKIEEKREQEERKAEERRKKAAEREEKANMSLELEKTRAERDVAQKQIELLTRQVGELQAQNTMLAAKLGRMGGVERSDSASTSSSKTGRNSQGALAKASS